MSASKVGAQMNRNTDRLDNAWVRMVLILSTCLLLGYVMGYHSGALDRGMQMGTR